jgi:T-complex protein 1 subunit delta
VVAACSNVKPLLPPASRCRESASSKKRDVRMMNIEAAKAVADAIRTSLGPRGMDKMVAQADGEVIITNDGATILNKMRVEQPAAKMLVELAKSQDVVAGDGTTSVTVLCGALLKKSLELLEKGVHPTVISDAFGRAAEKAVEVLTDSAIPVSIEDREQLIQAATTSLSSKIVGQNSGLLAPMAVDCLMKVLDPQRPDLLDLKDVKVVSKPGATIDDSEMVEGLVLDHKAARAAGGPSRMENAKVALIQFQVSPPKTDIENNVIISDYAQMDRILKAGTRFYVSFLCVCVCVAGRSLGGLFGGGSLAG